MFYLGSGARAFSQRMKEWILNRKWQWLIEKALNSNESSCITHPKILAEASPSLSLVQSPYFRPLTGIFGLCRGIYRLPTLRSSFSRWCITACYLICMIARDPIVCLIISDNLCGLILHMYFHGSTGHQAEGIGGGKAGPSNATACPVDFALIEKKCDFFNSTSSGSWLLCPLFSNYILKGRYWLLLKPRWL